MTPGPYTDSKSENAATNTILFFFKRDDNAVNAPPFGDKKRYARKKHGDECEYARWPATKVGVGIHLVLQM